MRESKIHYLIDNGHGNNTKGKRSPEWDDGTQLFEYKFNRDIVEILITLLDETDITYDVIVPELKDVSLRKRCKRANKIAKNKSKPCIFISVHGNAFKDKSVKGIETYHYPGSEDGKYLASVFQNNLIHELGWNNRGVKEAEFKVLRSTSIPAILTENGFYTNFEECKKMMQEGWQRRIAYAHYKSILEVEEE